MNLPQKPQALQTTLTGAGQWLWANRARIWAAVQSEPVQEVLRSQRAQQMLQHPRLQQVIQQPEVQQALRSPALQQLISGAPIAGSAPSQAQATPAQPSGYAPYTGETQRLQ